MPKIETALAMPPAVPNAEIVAPPSPSAPTVRSADADQIEQLAARLIAGARAGRFLITLDNEIEGAAVAELFGLALFKLRKWRDRGVGPLSFTKSGIAWYPARELARYLLAEHGGGRGTPLGKLAEWQDGQAARIQRKE